MGSLRDYRVAESLIEMLRHDLARFDRSPRVGRTRLLVEMAVEAQTQARGLNVPAILKSDIERLAMSARARARNTRREMRGTRVRKAA